MKVKLITSYLDLPAGYVGDIDNSKAVELIKIGRAVSLEEKKVEEPVKKVKVMRPRKKRTYKTK